MEVGLIPHLNLVKWKTILYNVFNNYYIIYYVKCKEFTVSLVINKLKRAMEKATTLLYYLNIVFILLINSSLFFVINNCDINCSVTSAVCIDDSAFLKI